MLDLRPMHNQAKEEEDRADQDADEDPSEDVTDKRAAHQDLAPTPSKTRPGSPTNSAETGSRLTREFP